MFYGWQVVNGGSARQLFHDSDLNARTGCDFFGLYKAGHALLRGKNIYEGDPQHKVVPCCFAFRYLPIGAAAGAPLTNVAPREAFLIWLALLELVAVLAALATYRRVRGVEGALLAGLWLAASPMFLEFYMGQSNLLQAALLLGVLFAADDGRQRTANGFLGAAMLWKLTGWLGVPVLAIKRQWRTLLLIAGLAVGSTVLYVAISGQGVAQFWENFRPVKAGAAIYRGDLGFIMLLRVAVGKSLPTWLFFGVPVIAVALTLALSLLGRRAPLAELFALWFAAYFFIYPTIWEHHYLMLLPPLVFLYGQGRAKVLWIAALLVALPTPYYLAGPHGAHWADFWPVVYHGVKPLAASIVWLVAAWRLWQTR